MAKRKLDVEDLQKNMKETAQRMWLAGLGAWATAEQEGGKAFKGLVKKGEVYEHKAKGKLDRLRHQFDQVADKAKDSAAEAWDKVEEVWDERVAGALKRLGVPSREEISHLTRRVEELTTLVGQKARGRRAARRKTTAVRRAR
jgi:poly(hydroxyalkanoate) granule-associated protein